MSGLAKRSRLAAARRSWRRCGCFTTVLLVALASFPLQTRAQALVVSSPFEAAVRRHYYERLEKPPLRAFGFELLFPGAGSYYTGIYLPAVCTLALSVAGASMWIAGARRAEPALLWSGVGVFVGARGFGLASAPIGASLLNAAFRRQLGLTDPP